MIPLILRGFPPRALCVKFFPKFLFSQDPPGMGHFSYPQAVLRPFAEDARKRARRGRKERMIGAWSQGDGPVAET